MLDRCDMFYLNIYLWNSRVHAGIRSRHGFLVVDSSWNLEGSKQIRPQKLRSLRWLNGRIQSIQQASYHLFESQSASQHEPNSERETI